MKSRLYLLAFALSALAGSTVAQPMGKVTENGVSMDVKSAVIVLDEANLELRVHLLPFRASAAEVSELQSGQTNWLDEKASPDAKKWKRCPFGHLDLSWRLTKESAGNAKEASFFLYAFGVDKPGSNVNLNKGTGRVDVTFAGALKAGQDVTVTTKGSDTLGSDLIAWDLKVKGKILALKRK